MPPSKGPDFPKSRPRSAMFEKVYNHVCKKHGTPLIVDPDKNILIGRSAIMQYLGLRSPRALKILEEKHGLPIMLRLDGRTMTSATMIDDWMKLQVEIQREMKESGAWVPLKRMRKGSAAGS